MSEVNVKIKLRNVYGVEKCRKQHPHEHDRRRLALEFKSETTLPRLTATKFLNRGEKNIIIDRRRSSTGFTNIKSSNENIQK